MEKWPVFICYRQVDGAKTAGRVFQLLAGQSVPAADPDTGELPTLDVYFDQAAPAAPNWKEVHRPHLEKSRALIVVCSPGAYTDLRRDGQDDFVHEEIDWWLDNGRPAPIPVDPLGTGLKWVPRRIVERWPDIQAIRMEEEEWDSLSHDDLNALAERTRARLIGGILPSAKTVYMQELEQEQERGRELAKALSRQKTTSRWLRLALYVALLLFLGSAVLGWLAYRQQQIARNQEEIARTRLIQTYLDRGQRAMEESDDSVAMLWLTEALRLNHDTARDYRIRQRIALILRNLPEIKQIMRQDIPGNPQSFDNRGGFLQIEGPTARLVELESGKERWSIQTTSGDILDAALSPDERYLAAITEDVVELWEIGSKAQVTSPLPVEGDEGGYAVAFSPDSAMLVAVSEEERRRRGQLSEDDSYELAVVEGWQTHDGSEASSFKPDVKFFRPVFSSDGDRLLTADWPLAWQWKMPEGYDVTFDKSAIDRLNAGRFSPDGRRLLALTDSGLVHILDPSSGDRQSDQQLREPVTDGTFSADGSRVALLTEDGRIQVLGAPSLEQVAVFDVISKKSASDHDAIVADAAAERLIVLRSSESAASEMRIWDVASSRPASPRLTRFVPELQAMFAPAADTFVEIGGGLARWMRLATRIPVLKPTSTLRLSEYQSFGRVIVDQNSDGFGVFDLATTKVTRSPATPGKVEAIATSEDGERIAAIVSSSNDETRNHFLYVWSATGFEELAKLPLPSIGAADYGAYRLEFGGDGNTLLVKVKNDMRLIEIDGGTTRWSRSFPDSFYEASLGGGTRFIVFGSCAIWDTSLDSEVDVDNCVSGQALQVDRGSSFYVGTGKRGKLHVTSLVGQGATLEIDTGVEEPDIAIGPKSERLYVSDSGVTRIWSTVTGEALSDALIGDERVTLSPDGRLLFTLDGTGEGRLWETSGGGLLARGLWHDGFVAGARFDAASEQIRTITADGTVTTWDLRPDRRDKEFLLSLAQLYAQRRVNARGAVEILTADETVSLWNSFSAAER